MMMLFKAMIPAAVLALSPIINAEGANVMYGRVWQHKPDGAVYSTKEVKIDKENCATVTDKSSPNYGEVCCVAEENANGVFGFCFNVIEVY